MKKFLSTCLLVLLTIGAYSQIKSKGTNNTYLNVASGKTANINNSITITGNDGATLNIGSGGNLSTITDTSSITLTDLFTNTSLTGVPTAPTATAGTNTTQIATTAFVQSALSGTSGSSSNFIEALSYLGSTVKVLPLGFSYDIPNSQTLTSGQLLLIAIYCSKSETLSSVSLYVATAGVYTGNNYNGVGLYTYNSGTLSLVASSATNSTLFTQGSSKITAAFTTPYSAVKGVYYVGLIYSSSAQTTAPSIRTSQTWGSYVNKLDFTNSAVLYGSLDSQTNLPSTINMSLVSVYPSSPFITVQ